MHQPSTPVFTLCSKQVACCSAFCFVMLPKTLIYLPVYVACREQEAAAYSSAEGNLPQMSLDQGTLVSSTRLSTQGAMASEHDAQTTLEIIKVTVSVLVMLWC